MKDALHKPQHNHKPKTKPYNGYTQERQNESIPQHYKKNKKQTHYN